MHVQVKQRDYQSSRRRDSRLRNQLRVHKKVLIRKVLNLNQSWTAVLEISVMQSMLRPITLKIDMNG